MFGMWKSRRFGWLWFGLLMCVFAAVMTVSVSATGAETVVEAENNTLLGRLAEYARENRAEVITVGCDALIYLFCGGYFVWQRAKTKHSHKQADELNKNTKAIVTSQSGIVNVANQLIDGFNNVSGHVGEMVKTYRDMENKEDARDRLLAVLVVQNAAMMEMLQTAYTHSQLPQGTKDLVVWKYTKCLQITEDDEKLAAVMAGIRRDLTPAEASEEVPAEGEDEEVQI